jgi:hypothetical protein
MSVEFAAVITGKATNFVDAVMVPFLERREEARVGLLQHAGFTSDGKRAMTVRSSPRR